MKSSSAVILVDPLHGGYSYVNYTENFGYRPLVIFTMSEKFLLENSYISLNQLNKINPVFFETTADEIYQYCIRHKLGVIGSIPCSEPGVLRASEIAEVFNLSSNSIQTAHQCRNKWLMRQSIQKNNLNSPNIAAVQNKHDVDCFLKDNDFPVVIKTPCSAGSDKVFFSDNLHSLICHMNYIITQPNLFGETTEYAVLESYIHGEEYFADMFLDVEGIHLVGIWKYEKNKNHYGDFIYTDIILYRDYKLSPDTIDYIKNAIKALGILKGSVHVEFKIDKDGNTMIIEIGSRIPGMLVPKLISESSNFNPYVENINVFTIKNYRMNKIIHFDKYCHVVCIPIETSGEVIEINGLDTIQSLSSYYYHDLKITKGDIVNPTKDLQNLAVVVYMRNKNLFSLKKDVQLVRSIFNLALRKEPTKISIEAEFE